MDPDNHIHIRTHIYTCTFAFLSEEGSKRREIKAIDVIDKCVTPRPPFPSNPARVRSSHAADKPGIGM